TWTGMSSEVGTNITALSVSTSRVCTHDEHFSCTRSDHRPATREGLFAKARTAVRPDLYFARLQPAPAMADPARPSRSLDDDALDAAFDAARRDDGADERWAPRSAAAAPGASPVAPPDAKRSDVERAGFE